MARTHEASLAAQAAAAEQSAPAVSAAQAHQTTATMAPAATTATVTATAAAASGAAETPAASAVPLPAAVPLEDPAAANYWDTHNEKEIRSRERTLKKQLFKKLMMLPRDKLTFSPFAQYKSVVDAAQAFGALGDFYREQYSEELAANMLAWAYNECKMKTRAPSIDDFLKMAAEAAQEKARQKADEVAMVLRREENKQILQLQEENDRLFKQLAEIGAQKTEFECLCVTMQRKIETLEYQLKIVDERNEVLKRDLYLADVTGYNNYCEWEVFIKDGKLPNWITPRMKDPNSDWGTHR